MNKIVTGFSLFLIVLLFSLSFSATVAFADTNCQRVYGGSETCTSGNISIEKTIQHPQSLSFDKTVTLTVNQVSNLKFRLSVKNTGNDKITNINVEDVLPEFMTFISGDGNYDANTRRLTTTIANLNPNETKDIFLNVKVETNKLPADQGNTCMVNQSTASAEGKSSSSTAQVCVQKQVLSKQVYPVTQVTNTPPTGPSLIALLGLLPTTLAGLMLRKKSLA